MIYENQTAFPASMKHGLKKKVGLGLTVALLGISQQALAHVEYYDLNQGAHIGDLTATGKVVSTAQYGSTPAGVVALGGIAANGLGTISSQQDLALKNPGDWNATNQSYINSGTFSGLTYNHATGSGTATVDVNDVTSFGWYEGTTSVLGDSHKVDMFNFRLATPQQVSISWNVDDGAGNWYNNGFTLYSGLLAYQAHDDANEKLNPKLGVVTKVQDALDKSGAPVDVQGIASAYRNTLTNTAAYTGQFNALNNWGQSNVSGNWSNVDFIQAVNSNNPLAGFSSNPGNTLESLTLLLGPGNYTIAASGAVNQSIFSVTNLHGHLTFSAASVAAVPLPGAVWLFMSAMIGMLGLNRRKSRALAL